jgi:hypothetical protein
MRKNYWVLSFTIFPLIMSCGGSATNSSAHIDSAAVTEAYLKEQKKSSESLKFYDDPKQQQLKLYSLPIEHDSATRMIQRFMKLPGATYVFGKKSFLLKADQIAAYLKDASDNGTPLANIRLMFGIVHNTTSDKDEITVIVAGLDKDNKYVLYNGSQVFEHCLPCPDQCPLDAPNHYVDDTIPAPNTNKVQAPIRQKK